MVNPETFCMGKMQGETSEQDFHSFIILDVLSKIDLSTCKHQQSYSK